MTVPSDQIVAKALAEMLADQAEVHATHIPGDMPWKLMLKVDMPELGGVKIVTLSVQQIVDAF